MKNYIKGTFTKSIFRSDNGFIVGLFRVRETDDEELKHLINRTITFTGYFYELNENERYLFNGYETHHPKYGDQFVVNKYEIVKPEGKDGLVEFLSSDLFPGVGEKTALKIIDKLGLDAIDNIIENPNVLHDIKGVSKQLATKIVKTIIDYEENHKTIVALSNMGFSMRDAINIYNVYGSETLRYIEHNIYSLIEDVDGISFPLVDRVARNSNIEANNEYRIKSAITYIISAICFSNGDSYLEYDLIKNELERFLNLYIDDETFNNYLQELEYQLKIVNFENKYYLYEVFAAEENIVEKTKYLVNKKIDSYPRLDVIIEKIEQKEDIVYNESQKQAIKMALENHISIITGGPGTGKTTIIRAIIEAYRIINKYNNEELITNVALLAPTGRASKRLSLATKIPAMTIHRFLKWNKDLDQFAVNEYNKDNSHLIIVDEASMIDVLLLDNLFKGLNNRIKFVLVGDYHQLPSILPGQVLRDFVQSQKIQTTYLDELYRQSEDSYIPTLANEIRKGNIGDELFESHFDYDFLECDSTLIVPHILNLCQQFLEEGLGYNDYQIMAPMYRGINGIDNLNRQLQKILNQKDNNKSEIKYGDVTYRVFDKVIQLVNLPDDNVYNGDIGIIIDVLSASESTSKKNEIIVDFDGNIVTYHSKDFNQIKHAYAISIHKSQGSEVDIAIIPMCLSYNRMLYRKLIYTGITRAKKKLYIVGNKNAFRMSINNANEQMRKSDLLTKLIHNI